MTGATKCSDKTSEVEQRVEKPHTGHVNERENLEHPDKGEDRGPASTHHEVEVGQEHHVFHGVMHHAGHRDEQAKRVNVGPVNHDIPTLAGRAGSSDTRPAPCSGATHSERSSYP